MRLQKYKYLILYVFLSGIDIPILEFVNKLYPYAFLPFFVL